MASSLLLLLDDIASVLDDVATMTKVAATKTAAVVGDDLALNARQLVGVEADRELSVVMTVARGSAINKAILVPVALAVSQFAPWAVTPLLMAGGGYLCYEGAEKILYHGHRRRTDHDVGPAQGRGVAVDPASVGPTEGDKIAGAIRTDFILSAEIIVITLGVVADRSLLTQGAVLVAIAAAMTVGVYGLVAGIVKLDDLGAWLASGSSVVGRWIGQRIVAAAPWLMRALSIAGTAAMFLVGGGIIAHGLPMVHDALHTLAIGHVEGASLHGEPWWFTPLRMLMDAVVAVVVGLLAIGVAAVGRRARDRLTPPTRSA